jgi:NADPH:quinone reductase-like Zn-dependent oxidoreductase
MRAMVFDHYGEPDVMSLSEEPVPEPRDGEVLIRVGVAGVNPSDSKARSGEGARRAIEYEISSFLSSLAWMLPVLWSEPGRAPMDSGKEIA